MLSRSAAIVLAAAVVSQSAAADLSPYAGPAAGVRVESSLPLADFEKDVPGVDAPRELRLVLRDALSLTDIEKQGIKGGGGVREVPVKVYGSITLLIPFNGNQPSYEAATGELIYLGVNRIGFKGPLRADAGNPLRKEGGAVRGTVLFPVSIQEPKREKPRSLTLAIALDLEIQEERFAYTPDRDASIPPWRSDKTKPSGFKVTGTWRSIEERPDARLELDGKIAGSAGCFRIGAATGRFFPVQAIDLASAPGGMSVVAHASTERVDGHDSQWAVKELPEAVDLRRFNGLRLKVKSASPAAGRPIPAAVAVAFRVKGQPWFACRTVAPLLGGAQDHIVDFGLFARGTANPGHKAGPDLHGFPDLSQVDAVAVGVANPFGVGDVSFVVESLEAVRHTERGAGEPPPETVEVSVDARVKEVFAGAGEVPGRLFGYHLASPRFESNDQAPPWFNAPPVSGNGTRLLELARPESLRPIDHTNFSAETGASMVHPLNPGFARAAGDPDGTMHTITNENLWARPRWMDADIEAYAGGIREMFRQVGTIARSPDRPDCTLHRIEFWNEPFMWARHINRGQSTLSAGPGDPGGNRGRKAWNDPTQFTFMPGKLGAEVYARFFNAAAEGLAETNPHAEIGGMSSGLFGEDFFSQLTNYVTHFLTASHERIDFLTEHHYSSHAPSTAAAYEVVTAWSLAKHGKRWPIWNTEANDLDDVAPGDRRSAEAAKAYTDRNRAYYNYRDILELILKSRDKAAGRAIHALWGRGWFKNEGEQLMYLHTAALRGAVVFSSANDPAILPVAAWEDGRLATYLLNDSPFPRRVVLSIAGAASAEGIEASGLRLNDDATAAGVFPAAFRAATADGRVTLAFDRPLAPREIMRVLAPGVPAPRDEHRISQHFSDVLVADVLPGKPAIGRIAVDAAAWNGAKKAILRIVAREIQSGEATIRVGGVEAVLPATTAEGGHHVITDIPLPALPEVRENSISVSATCDGKRDGWTLYGLSLLTSDR